MAPQASGCGGPIYEGIFALRAALHLVLALCPAGGVLQHGCAENLWRTSALHAHAACCSRRRTCAGVANRRLPRCILRDNRVLGLE
ncbi:hypothetical protein F5888DRAFT_420706 [Russula emetica]|nr:hypothetical protein F5888DRAFT_420706 [Russula emetica]